MKKYLAVLLALALALGASAALADTFIKEGVFSIWYPDEGWSVVDNADDDENTETFQRICMLVDESAVEGPVIDISMRYYDNWAEFSLFNCSDEEFNDYIESTTEELTERFGEATYLGVLNTDAYHIPFLFYYGVDEEGPLHYAETMTNGWTFRLLAYAYTDDNYDTAYELTGETLDLVEQIIRSFTPAT